MASGSSPEGPGLYVHVPFCVSRCAYCAFRSQTDLALREAYLRALAREAQLRSAAWTGFDTVYIGGGTPSALGLAGLERLVGALQPLDLVPAAQWTVEANPDDVDVELLGGLRALGVARLSLGAQSFDEGALRFLGRRHDAAAARRAAERARQAGFEELSLDLIYGLPGQRLQAWEADLRAALALEPSHISAYELTVEPGTALAARVQRGAAQLPDDERLRRLHLHGVELLEARGWLHYEVSSYARGPLQRSRHNRKYWRHVPYLGLGPAAHSFDGRCRWWNRDDIGAYARELAAGHLPVQDSERLDAAALRLERLALGFRCAEGVALEDLGEGVLAAVEQGLLVLRDGRARPTREGLLVADGLALRFA